MRITERVVGEHFRRVLERDDAAGDPLRSFDRHAFRELIVFRRTACSFSERRVVACPRTVGRRRNLAGTPATPAPQGEDRSFPATTTIAPGDANTARARGCRD